MKPPLPDHIDLRRTPRFLAQEKAGNCEACPYCGSVQLHGRKCKVWCDACGHLVRTCADL